MGEEICDSKSFTILLEEEVVVPLIAPVITFAGFPASAQKGTEITGLVKIYNPNDVKVEAITDIRASKADGSYVSLATFPERDVVLGWGPKSTREFKITTEWKWGAMPEHDWTFKVDCCLYPMGTYLV